MRRKLQKDTRELTDYDLFLARRFCADELKKYIAPMRDFWRHSSSYLERGPGEHALLDGSWAGSAGYRVEKRRIKSGPLRNLAGYPFVRTRCLKVLPSYGEARFALRRVFSDPVRVEEFYCVLKSDSAVAFLTEEAYAATLSGRAAEACVPLGREEAYAILAGKTLERTLSKLKRIFDMEENEWIDKISF